MENCIIVAPNNYSGNAKTDFVCVGRNDELVIQKAIDKAVGENRNIMLLNGMYHIDAFHDYYEDGGPKTAVCFPNAWREIRFFGENLEYGFQKRFDNGVVLYVSQEALSSIDGETDVIRGRWTEVGIQNGSSLHMENISVFLANNSHKIRCVDLRRTDRVEIINATLVSYADLISEDSSNGLGTPPPIPEKAV